MAVAALMAHRFRSLLTILGIVIGITTVVTVSSLLTGLRAGIVTFFQEFGPDNVFLSRVSGDPMSSGRPKERRRRPIQPEYAELVPRMASTVMRASVNLYIRTRPGEITARVQGFESANVWMMGTSAESFQVQPREIAQGRVFTGEEAGRGQRVAVIGWSVAEALFPDGAAEGKVMTIGGAEYRVVGVYAPAKGGFFGENGLDRQIVIPLRTAQMRYPNSESYMVVFQARPGLRDDALEELRSVLRRIRRIPTADEDDFALSTPDQIIARFDSITRMVLLVSIGISALGLLVGGIGVMNIMLVSVTERTREIGIRKAVGARRGDIVLQFLMEAVALTGLGGLLGIISSILVTLLVGTLVPSLPSKVPPAAVLAGFTVSVLVGIFFGVWPATKAARLDPVDALRYE
ncbi:MAG: ABC transporter permease [Bryobacteraceae bacterium]